MRSTRLIALLRWAAVLVLLFGPFAQFVPVQAQTTNCRADVEPNNTEGQAEKVSSAFCIAGDLSEVADQDLFIWTVTDDDAKFLWDLTVQGPDGTVTSAKILQITSEPGVEPVVAGTQIGEVDWTQTSTSPATGEFLIAPGHYLVGISRTDPADSAPLATTTYTMDFARGDRLPKKRDKEPNDTPDAAIAVTNAFETTGDARGSADYYAWSISDKEAEGGWELNLLAAIGNSLGVTVMKQDGTVMTNQYTNAEGRIHLFDMQFDSGTYLVQVSGASADTAPYVLGTTSTAAPVGDVEPNDMPNSAVAIDLADPVVTGRLAATGDIDQYSITVDDELAGSLFDVRVLSRSKIDRRVCLTSRETGVDLQCKDGPGGAALSNILLPKGGYLIRVSGDADPNAQYILRIDTTTPPSPTFESEPNDSEEFAVALDPATLMQGRFYGTETDTFRLTTSGDPQLWDIEVTGTGITDVDFTARDGTALATAQVDPNGAGGSIYDQYLTPGDHWIRLTGTNGDYTVSLRANGPPPPDGEHESNNDELHAEPMLLGQPKSGRVVDGGDTDTFRFSLAAHEHVKLKLQSPSDGIAQMSIYWGPTKVFTGAPDKAGAAVTADLLLEAGDYLVVLSAIQPSTNRYQLTTEREDPFVQTDDQEPNDNPSMAQTIRAGQTVSGTVPSGDPGDYYAIAPGAGRDLSFTAKGDNIYLNLTDGTNNYAISQKTEGGPYTTDERVPKDIEVYLVVSGQGDYTVTYGKGKATGGILNPSILGGGSPPPVDMSLTMDEAEVAAYWQQQQTITGTLSLKNTTAETEKIGLQTATSHYAWHATVGSDSIELTAGQSLTVPVTVVIDPDAWVDIPVRITIGAFVGDAAPVTAFFEVTPTADASPVEPVNWWPVPKSMLGGLNLAATALGATPANTVNADTEKYLYDGVAPVGLDFYAGSPVLPIELTVDLAGDDPAPIAGFVLNPQPTDINVTEQVRQFEVQLSSDGVNFTTVVTGTLSPLIHDQVFALEQPVQATQARLRILTSYNPNPTTPGYVSLGEFSVIAQPGYAPSMLSAVNLADPALGAHIVRMNPQQAGPDTLDSMLSPDLTLAYMAVDNQNPAFDWVIGFGNDRAAQISQFGWHEPEGTDTSGYGSITQVVVEVSMGSSAGPWKKVGTWKIKPGDDGAAKPLTLKKATWARFVRFSGTLDFSRFSSFYLPGQISVIEAPMSDTYTSAIGVYGSTNVNGPYEVANPPTFAGATDTNDASDDPANPTPLDLNTEVQGRAQIGKDVDWYTVTAPKDDNTLTLTLTGAPSVDVTVRLHDKNDKVVEATRAIGGNTGTVTYTATVKPGATYKVEVQQPPHSIMFTFDTSGSMGAYEGLVKQSLRAFAGGVVKGQEFVNVMAFESDPLMDTWTDDTYLVYGAINGYYDQSGSSSAEQAILDSTQLLAGQEGTTAILIITDAETSSFGKTEEMWGLLDTVQPRIFAVHVGGNSTPQLDKNLMQDWSFNGGYYQYTTSQADMDRAFDRAATWLRRPAAYGLSVASSFAEPATPTPAPTEAPVKPGSLAVTAPESSGGTGAAQISDQVSVEIILDTSGSMLGGMADGQRRIDVARSVLADLVTTKLPAGIPVTLRVFGNQPDSCDTNLVVPLGPLDPTIMSQTIQGIEPVNLVRTPIGASLQQVANDLAGASGPKVVILVTDGEETCDGDPAKAIRDLKAQGFDVQINIVGFALDDDALRAQFADWAQLGGGAYYDATNAAELSQAIAKVAQAPFRVLDANGTVVATGTVGGDPIDLPPGTYTVDVLTDPEQTIDQVVVQEDQQTTVQLPGT